MYVRIGVCMYVFTYVRIYVYIYVCVYVCMYVCMCVCICECACVCIYVHAICYRSTGRFLLNSTIIIFPQSLPGIVTCKTHGL
jgi:hypothetical protein